MPYKSAAQRGYFHANRAKLEAQGVNVSEWDRSSKGKKLPYHASRGGSIQSALRTARKYADGGEVNEWEDLPKSPEDRPQITVTPPQAPGDLVSKYTSKARDWFNQPSQSNPLRGYEPSPQPDFIPVPGAEIGDAVRHAGSGIVQGYKDLIDPLEKNDEGEYNYIANEKKYPKDYVGKVAPVFKDPISFGAPIIGETIGTFGGVPGQGALWGGLKAAGYGINHAAIAFGLKASQAAKSVPKAANMAAKVAAEQGFLDTSKFKQVGHQLGFMPGGVYKDPTGVPYYLKFGTDLEQVKNENLASKLYQLAGTPAADTSVTHIGGKPGIASKLLQNSHQLSETKVPYSQIPGLHDNFVVDAWLANHDAVGTGGENPLGNIMIQDGKAVRIDGGGALRYKGSGEIKGHFHDEADEIFSMRNPEFSKRSAQVFGDISPEALKEGAQKVADVDIRKLTDLIARYGPGDDAEKAALVTKLVKRRQYIMDHFGVQPQNAAKPVPAPHELPPNPTNMPREKYEQIPFTEEDYEKFGKEIPPHQPEDIINHGRPPQPTQKELPPNLTRPDVDHNIDQLKEASILSPSEIDKLLQQKKLGKTELENIAKKLVAGTFSHDHWKGAVSLWKIAENVNPQTAEALFRNLPPSVQPSVGYAIKAMADKIGHSPWDTVEKGSGFLYAGKYPTEYDYFSTQTNKFPVPEGLKKDKSFLDNVKKGLEAIAPNEPKLPQQVVDTPQPKKPSLIIPPKELVQSLSHFKYTPGTTATKLVNAYGEDVSKIANSMYRLTGTKGTEFVDEIYKKLPFELQVGVNGDLSELYTKFGDPEAKAFKGAIPSPEGKKILNAFEQIPNWQSYIPKLGKFETPKFPDEATKKLAENTGHNINVLFWKGNYKAEKYPEQIKDFATKSKERANYLTHEKAIAASGNYGGNKAPYVARAPKALRVDYSDLVQDATYNSHDMHNIIEAARKEKADVLVIDNIKDYGYSTGDGFNHTQTQYAFINQNVLRAPKAKFDPNMLHLAKPLLGLAGGGLFVYGTVAGQEDKMNRGGIPALMHRAKTLARGGAANHPRHPAGMIKSSIPGRTDKIPMNLPSGSFVIPADIPSALGQGNTMAGEKILGAMFKSGPYSPGSTQSLTGKLPKAKGFRTGVDNLLGARKRFADGGEVPDDGGVDIIAAGGESILYPDQVRAVGHGDLDAGHKVLKQFVLHVRKQNIETLKKLKGPKD